MAQSETRQTKRAAQRANAKKGPSKRPEPTKVLLDAMPTVVGDDVEFFHEGEWVTVRPAMTMGVVNITLELMARQMGPQMLDLADIADEDPSTARAEMEGAIDDRKEISTLMSKVILDWNVTNFMTGEPLPSPTDGDAFDELTVTEFAYMNAAVTRALNQGGRGDFNPEVEVEDPKESSSE